MSIATHPTREAERLRLARLSATHHALVPLHGIPAAHVRVRTLVPMARWSRDRH